MAEGFEQLRELARSLDLTEGSMRRKARDVVRKHAFAVERGAKVRAPVDTGNLRNSINSGFSGDGIGTPFVGEVGPEAHYGIYLELGTARMAPQPFLGPAFDEVEPAFIAALEALADEAAQ